MECVIRGVGVIIVLLVGMDVGCSGILGYGCICGAVRVEMFRSVGFFVG